MAFGFWVTVAWGGEGGGGTHSRLHLEMGLGWVVVRKLE